MRRKSGRATPKAAEATPEKPARRTRRGRGRSPTPEDNEEESTSQSVDNQEHQEEAPSQTDQTSDDEALAPKKRGRRSARASSTDVDASVTPAKSRRGRPKRTQEQETIEEEVPAEEPVSEIEAPIVEENVIEQETIVVSNGEESHHGQEEASHTIHNEIQEQENVEHSPDRPETIPDESNEAPQHDEETVESHVASESNQGHDDEEPAMMEIHEIPIPQEESSKDSDVVVMQTAPEDSIDVPQEANEDNDAEDGEIVEEEKPPTPEVIPKRARRRFMTHFSRDDVPKNFENDAQNKDEEKMVSTKRSSDDIGRSNIDINESIEAPKSHRRSIRATSKSEEKENANKELTPKIPIQRKRKWITQKSVDNKQAIISISTDSLKDLIPEVIPVPLSDVKLDISPEIEVMSEQELPEDLNARKRRVSEHSIEDNIDNPKQQKQRRVTVTVTQDITQNVQNNIGGNNKKQNIDIGEEEAAPVSQKTPTPPSPPKQMQSNILYITNLVRPFTVLQLKGLLARTGKIVENGFWIDKIKSKCYVKYETEDEAVETRHALHGVRWPTSNPKCLNVDFGREKDMEKAIISTLDEGARQAAVETSNKETSGSGASGFGWSKADAFRAENEDKTSRDRPVREWDLGKRDESQKENEEGRRGRDDRDRRDRRDRDKERDRGDRERNRRRSGERSTSERRERRRSRSVSQARRQRKTENEPPIRLLDDLFRKTKATPCIYWLPLTSEQITEREEVRRKRMEEQERQLAEMRKAREERQKEREKMRRRSRSRSRDREQKRRRSRSRSASRSRSRSRDNRRRFNR